MNLQLHLVYVYAGCADVNRGIFHTTAPAYASEVCPVILRAYLTSFVNLSAM